MADYKSMCEKLLTLHYNLETGLKTLAEMDKYGDLNNVIMNYFYALKEIDKRMTPFPKKVKVRRVSKKL